MKKFHTFSVITGGALLAFLIWKIGILALWAGLTRLGWGLLPLILIEGVAELFHTVGWRFCLSGRHRSLPFLHIYRIWMAGSSINFLTPTATLGGEVTKGSLLALTHRGPEAVSAVVVGKLSYALAELLFVIAGSFVLLWTVKLPAGIWVGLLVGSALLGAGILGFLFVQKYGKLGSLVRWLAARRLGGKPLQRAAKQVTEVDSALRLFYKEQPFDLPLSVLWHTLGLAIGIAGTWLFLYLLADDHSMIAAAAIWFLASWLDLLAFAIPSNIGVLEATRVAVFTLLEFPAATGLTFSIASRLARLFWAAVGLFFYATMLGRTQARGVLAGRVLAGRQPGLDRRQAASGR